MEFTDKDWAEHVFLQPSRAVKAQQQMQLWEKSEAYSDYIGFITSLNEAAKGTSLTADYKMSKICDSLMELLNKLDKMIDDTPPIDQPQRFGNQAFRYWYQQLKDTALDLLQDALPEKYYSAIPEIMIYLVEGFGNSTRIDYGTGHEISFLMFLCCLFKLNILNENDQVVVVCKIFNRYIEIARKLQLAYRMEPAGSHGVWSLDDYQFVPFIWGSSQLFGHPKIEPHRFLEDAIINTHNKDYMFISCIDYIRQVKTGLFAEHSNQLWSISGVSSWSKINSGLIRMYKKEVLGKFPVVQHILFGSILTFKTIVPTSKLRSMPFNYKPPAPPSFASSTPSETTTDSRSCDTTVSASLSSATSISSDKTPILDKCLCREEVEKKRQLLHTKPSGELLIGDQSDVSMLSEESVVEEETSFSIEAETSPVSQSEDVTPTG